ncbi:hypothetical protein SAMN02927921_03994 [Sinomicrobium oceani]|uniref:DUF6438 domain-containing protein n=1 Tax=Sinomicrobium oceani TaxID=1150368 RepID=A0A1K1RUL1_9FLAO|nr:DUF6438 domain-containing protein [Sinomicrobium oceani]SFW75485.1 hypothetical protein SAMN02927921_03994 [Sinomicrobium oceani]
MRKFGTTFLMVCSILASFGCQRNADYIVEYSTTGCFGDCPVLDIKLIEDEVFYNFIEHHRKEGVFYSKISKEQRNVINDLITRILEKDIKEEYLGDVVDAPATYFKLYRGEDTLLKTNYDDYIAPKILDSLYSYLLGISENNLTSFEAESIHFSTRKDIGIETFSPPPPPEKNNE